MTDKWLVGRGGGWPEGQEERSRSRSRSRDRGKEGKGKEGKGKDGQGREGQSEGSRGSGKGTRASHAPIIYILGRRERYLGNLVKERGEGLTGGLYVGTTENLMERLREHEGVGQRGTGETVRAFRAKESQRGFGKTRGDVGDTWMVLGLVEGFGPKERGGLDRAKSLEAKIHRQVTGGEYWEGGFWALRGHIEQLVGMLMGGGGGRETGWSDSWARKASPVLARQLGVRWFLGGGIGRGRRWSVKGVGEVWEEEEAWRGGDYGRR